jgi:hypothetical protein
MFMRKQEIASKSEREAFAQKAREIVARAEARKGKGSDDFGVDWQACLELLLLMMEKPFLDNPGQLLPVQIDGDEEWDFYVQTEIKLDLPPDVCAVLVTPSAFKEMPLPFAQGVHQEDHRTPEKNNCSVLISSCQKQGKVIQVSLPGINSVGVDVFEEGKHTVDYTYKTTEECLDDLNRITWMFFGPKDRWAEHQVIQYTENWYAKSRHTYAIEDVPFHTEYSYLHHPELIRLSPLDAIFKLIAATIPKEYGTFEKAIELANDLNEEVGLPVITVEGILNDDKTQAQALLSRIVVEIDMNLDVLDFVDGIDFPDRSIGNLAYNRAFDDVARQIYQKITGCPCPEGLKVE